MPYANRVRARSRKSRLHTLKQQWSLVFTSTSLAIAGFLLAYNSLGGFRAAQVSEPPNPQAPSAPAPATSSEPGQATNPSLPYIEALSNFPLAPIAQPSIEKLPIPTSAPSPLAIRAVSTDSIDTVPNAAAVSSRNPFVPNGQVLGLFTSSREERLRNRANPATQGRAPAVPMFAIDASNSLNIGAPTEAGVNPLQSAIQQNQSPESDRALGTAGSAGSSSSSGSTAAPVGPTTLNTTPAIAPAAVNGTVPQSQSISPTQPGFSATTSEPASAPVPGAPAAVGTPSS